MIDVAGQKKNISVNTEVEEYKKEAKKFFQVFSRKSNLSSCVVWEFLSSCADNIIEIVSLFFPDLVTLLLAAHLKTDVIVLIFCAIRLNMCLNHL